VGDAGVGVLETVYVSVTVDVSVGAPLPAKKMMLPLSGVPRSQIV
jgi:hypothetical protein